MNDAYAVLVITIMISGFLGAIMGNEQGRTIAGTCLGLLFGPLGLIAALSLKDRREIENLKQHRVRELHLLGEIIEQLHEQMQLHSDSRTSATIQYKCPHCNSRLQAPEAKVGSTQSCPKCHTSHKVPAA